MWWREAERCQVLPLDDRFGPRFADNARRYHGPRRHFVLHAGVGHIPTDVAPDVRGRSYLIEAEVRIEADSAGVLIAHGDATSGYSLFVRDGRLVHDINIGGLHQVVVSDRPIPPGNRRLGFRLEVGPLARVPKTPPAAHAFAPTFRTGTLLIDGAPAGTITPTAGFNNFVSWSGLDIGRDRGSPVSDYAAPFEFTGTLRKVTVTLDAHQAIDAEAAGRVELARE